MDVILLERVAKLAHNDSLQTKLDKLDRVLAMSGASKEDDAACAQAGGTDASVAAKPQRGSRPTEWLTNRANKNSFCRNCRLVWRRIQ